jgi:DNA-binding NtrC family response regulator
MKVAIAVTDNPLERLLIAEIETLGHEAVACASLAEAVNLKPHLAFAQWPLNRNVSDLFDGLAKARAVSPPVPVVVLVSPNSSSLLERARLAGATDALFCPPDRAEIRAEIEEISGTATALDFLDGAKFEELRRTTLVGNSPGFLACVEQLCKAARAEANLLLLGESGTGKEVFARSLYSLSQRASEPFLAVNCANLEGNRLENELFGHEQGSFTGADRLHRGTFEAVGAGVLLLDEIGEMEMPLQAKLLRAIEQREFFRLGSTKPIQLRARVVCATSLDLDEAAAKGAFRRDLLVRIDQFRISLPSLRERRADILPLLCHFLAVHSKGRAVAFSASALDLLQNFDYPMNIRQLDHTVSSAVTQAYPGSIILPKHLPVEIMKRADPPRSAMAMSTALSYDDARAAALQEVDRIYLPPLLRKHNGNQSSAAEEIRIDRKTLAARLKGIKRGENDG